MNAINPAAAAAREQARETNGQFGHQSHSAPELVPADAGISTYKGRAQALLPEFTRIYQESKSEAMAAELRRKQWRRQHPGEPMPPSMWGDPKRTLETSGGRLNIEWDSVWGGGGAAVFAEGSRFDGERAEDRGVVVFDNESEDEKLQRLALMLRRLAAKQRRRKSDPYRA